MSRHHRTNNPIHLMKANLLFNLVLLSALSTLSHAAVTINWGSETFSEILDSHGVALDNSYVFQLGVFSTTTGLGEVPYVPELRSLTDWAGHWKVFDQADYDVLVDGDGKSWGTFSSHPVLMDDGTSDSSFATAGFNFTGLDAYLWIYKPGEAALGGENLLVRAAGWEFPATSECCGTTLPLDWSVSDLTVGDVPTLGHQKGSGSIVAVGAGDSPYTGSSDSAIGALQTGTFVPEPGSALLVLLLGMMAVLDRRRVWIYRCS